MTMFKLRYVRQSFDIFQTYPNLMDRLSKQTKMRYMTVFENNVVVNTCKNKA